MSLFEAQNISVRFGGIRAVDRPFSRHLDLNVAVFHLASVTLQADGASLGDGESSFEQLAIAGTAGGPALHDGFD